MSALDKQVGGSHYRQGSIQPIQYIEANKLQYLEGAVVQRVTRHDKETGKGRQDIEKAIHELQLLLELRYPQDPAEEFVENMEAILKEVTAPPNYHPPYEMYKTIPVLQPLKRGLIEACLVCGASDGHGGLQCPSTLTHCGAQGNAQGNPNIDQAMEMYVNSTVDRL